MKKNKILIILTCASIYLCHGSRFFRKKPQDMQALEQNQIQRFNTAQRARVKEEHPVSTNLKKRDFTTSHNFLKKSINEARSAKNSFEQSKNDTHFKLMLSKTEKMVHELQSITTLVQQNKSDIKSFETTLTDARNIFFNGRNNTLNFPRNSLTISIELPLNKNKNEQLNSKILLLKKEAVALTFAQALNKTSTFSNATKKTNTTEINNRISNLEQTIINIKNIHGFKELSESHQPLSTYLKKSRSLISKIDPVNILLISSISALLVLLSITIDNLAEDIY